MNRTVKNLLAGVGVTFILLMLIEVLTSAQTGGQKPTQMSYVQQIRPQAVPSGAMTDIIKQDAYLCQFDVTATGQTITVQDRQATPVTWLANALGSNGSPTTWTFSAGGDNSYCRWFPGGISWQASGTGATGYMTVKCQTAPCTLVSGQ